MREIVEAFVRVRLLLNVQVSLQSFVTPPGFHPLCISNEACRDSHLTLHPDTPQPWPGLPLAHCSHVQNELKTIGYKSLRCLHIALNGKRTVLIQSTLQPMPPNSPIHTHSHINGNRLQWYQSALWEQFGVRCLAQGDFDTPTPHYHNGIF